MRRTLLVGVGALFIAVAAESCGGSGGGGGGGGGGDQTLTLDGTGFGADAGDMAFYRVLAGGTVAYCSSASVGGGNPSFSFTTPAVLDTKTNYTSELFIDIDATGTYGKAQDDEWKITVGKITSGTAANLVIDASAAQSNIGWKANKGCPGK
jgi:hypothetical protein